MQTPTPEKLKTTSYNPKYAADDNLKIIQSFYNTQYQKGVIAKRKRKPVIAQQAKLLASIIANFHIKGMDTILTITLSKDRFSKASRYTFNWYTYRNMSAVINVLVECGYIDIVKGKYVSNGQNTSTTISLTGDGYDLLEGIYNVRNEIPEPIQLVKKVKQGNKEIRSYIDYPETDVSLKLRGEMNVINQHLYNLDVTFDGEPLAKTGLYRIFHEPFSKHGRLYGGSWYSIKDRLNLLINNKPVVELDFTACSLSILCNLNKVVVDGDPFQKGRLSKYPRKAIKTFINSMIQKPNNTRFPKGLRTLFGIEGEKYAFGMVKLDALNEYPFLGYASVDIMHIDSTITVQVMLEAIKQGLELIPLHDAFYVAQENESLLVTIINSVTTSVTGNTLDICINKV